MSIKKHKEDRKYNNTPRIDGKSPQNKYWKYTDSEWLNYYERRARGLIKDNETDNKKIPKKNDGKKEDDAKTEVDALIEEE